LTPICHAWSQAVPHKYDCRLAIILVTLLIPAAILLLLAHQCVFLARLFFFTTAATRSGHVPWLYCTASNLPRLKLRHNNLSTN
jgi:hypothetical protein